MSSESVTFFDDTVGKYVPYQCPVNSIPGLEICIFHYHNDPNRDNDTVNKAFLKLLDDSTKKRSRLLTVGFKLENLNFPKEVNTKIFFQEASLTGIKFDNVHFNQDIIFDHANLTNVSFFGATFEKVVYFIYAKFKGQTLFRDAKFIDEANFNLAEFFDLADFRSCIFGDKMVRHCSCMRPTRFVPLKNTQPLTYFNGTKFYAGVRFDGVTFERQTLFDDTTFRLYASFISAGFHKALAFTGAHFDCDVSFNITRFHSMVSFLRANFVENSKENRLGLHGSKFDGEADFRSCKFGITLFNEEYPMDEDRISRELNKTVFSKKADFKESSFANFVTMFNTTFKADAVFSKCDFSTPLFVNYVNFAKALLDSISFHDEVDFKTVTFPNNSKSISIDFSHSTFRKRVRFIGSPQEKITLASVSFKGVDLTNVEFSYVDWIKEHDFGYFERFIIIDEKMLETHLNFEDVIKIYNQLRKNYESKLLFSEASHFFVGEMESRRKWLKNRGKKEKLAGIGARYYDIYRKLAWYGESVTLPLFIWATLTIVSFTILRSFACDQNSILVPILGNPECVQGEVNKWMKLILDSIVSLFPVPFSKNHFDTLQHILGLPILGTAFIALRRKFERLR